MQHLQKAVLQTIWNESLKVAQNEPKKVRIGNLIREVKKLSDSPISDLQAIEELTNILDQVKESDSTLAPLAERLVSWNHFGTLEFKTRVKLDLIANRLGGKHSVPKKAFQIKEFFRTIIRFATKHSQVSPQFRELLLKKEFEIAEAINKDPFDKDALNTVLTPIQQDHPLSSAERAINLWLASVKKDPFIFEKLNQEIKKEEQALTPPAVEEQSPPTPPAVTKPPTAVEEQKLSRRERKIQKKDREQEISAIHSTPNPKEGQKLVNDFLKKQAEIAQTQPSLFTQKPLPTADATLLLIQSFEKAKNLKTTDATKNAITTAKTFKEIFEVTQTLTNNLINSAGKNRESGLLAGKENSDWQKTCWETLTKQEETLIKPTQGTTSSKLTHLTKSRAKPIGKKPPSSELRHKPRKSIEPTLIQPETQPQTSQSKQSPQAFHLPGLGQPIHLKTPSEHKEKPHHSKS